MMAGGVSEGLAWWRDHRALPVRDKAAMRELLAALQAWKVQHDTDRAGHPPPFLRMAWDGVFADQDEQVSDAILELEAALSASA